MQPLTPDLGTRFMIAALVGATTATATAKPPVIPDGYMVIEGDILVPEGFYEADGTFATNLWPNGVVPYAFDADIPQANRDQALLAMSFWEDAANIDFRPADFDPNWIQFHDANVNNSPVGMQFLGGQPINIVSWGNEFIIAHELAHALGVWHEQSRADRDDFIVVNLANVCQDCCGGGSSCNHNFDLHPAGSYEWGPYDFDSLMHYGQCDFSTCQPCNSGTPTCWTITVRPPNQAMQSVIGQRNHLSDLDMMTMSFLYPEDDWRFVNRDWPNLFQSGTFIEPWQTFTQGVDLTPEGGTLWILEAESYDETGTFDRPMTIRAPLGGVTIGQ